MFRFAAAALLLLIACSHQSEESFVPKLEGPATRAVVIGPSTAATLAAFGISKQVVGVSDYCSDPAFAHLPRVGGQHDPSLERIAALQPDLVLVQGASPSLQEWCSKSQITFQNFRTDSWAGWLGEVEVLGELFGKKEQATQLRKEAQSKLNRVSGTTKVSPTVLLVVGRRKGEASGLVVAGAASFLSELLVVAGGKNAAGENARDYFDLNEESLLRLAPEVVLEFLPPDNRTQELWRKAYPNIPAVRNGRVWPVTEAWAVEPGPRMPDTAALLADLLDSAVIMAR